MKTLQAIAFAFIIAIPALAFAQRGGFDPTEWLKRADANGNGQLEPDEVDDRMRGFLERFAGDDYNRDRPLDIDRMGRRMQERMEERRREEEERRRDDDDDDDRDRDRDRGRSESSEPQPLVPGFGLADEIVALEPVPGFDVPLSTATSRTGPEYPEEVVRRVDDMLRRYDRNRNGQLDREEWENARWRTDPNQSDANRDGILTRSELLGRITRFENEDRSRDEERRRGDDDDDRREESRDSGRPSFGRPGGGPPSGGPSGGSSGQPDDRIQRYAQGLMGRYDRNRNGQLEKDEWSEMRGNYAEADSNKDEIINGDELAGHLARMAGGNSSRSGGSSSSSSASSGGQPTYRFLSPTERLPSGLPDWFARSDANSDGQVMMHEFSTTWDERKAEEFAGFDVNRDGVITPAEALGSPQPVASENRERTESRGGWGRDRR